MTAARKLIAAQFADVYEEVSDEAYNIADDAIAALKEEGWRVVKLAEATWYDPEKHVTFRHGTHCITEEA